jgi:Flp pilus assembly protein TadG
MGGIAGIGRVVSRFVKQFIREERANTAMIFAMTFVSLVSAAGAGIDLSRALVAKSRLASALDSAALAVGSTNGLTNQQMTDLANQYFNANYPTGALGSHNPVVVTPHGQSISLSVTGDIPTTLLQILQINKFDLAVNNEVIRSVTKLRVALVLDNTGSMTQTDATGTSKITALRTASHQLLTQLQNAAVNPGDVQVAIIPFAKDVNAGAASFNANWVRWTEWDSSVDPSGNASLTGSWSTNTVCTGSACTCTAYPTLNDTLGHNARTCSCTGSGSSKSCKTKTWVPNAHNTWSGCVMDRDQNKDTQNDTATIVDTTTLFPAEQYNYGSTSTNYCSTLTSLMSLSYDWTGLNTKIDAMQAGGGTNQTIGLAWGWQALSQGSPLMAPPIDPTIQNVIVLLSDGLNTQDRWPANGNGVNTAPAVDARMALACTNAKAANVMIYTVLVMSGNSTVLQACATDQTKYFELTTAGQIVTAFNQIGTELANLHLSR